MAKLRVRDLMTENPFTLTPTDDLATLYDLLDTKHIRHLPVIDDDGELVGLVTHRDLVKMTFGTGRELPVSNQRALLRHIRLSEVMTPDVETTTADADLLAVAQLMLDNKFGCMPVVEGSRLVGIITEADFMRHVIEIYGE